VVVARKKDGGVRLCVNLKDVNKALIPERYPLPKMEELNMKVSGAIIDLKWSYLQLPLSKEARQLTAFVTHEGVFQFVRLPFDLATGPSAFQRIVSVIIDGIDGCANILDDILVWGRTMAEHDERLRRVLQRLDKYNATVRADKCVIGASEVEFNGHRVCASGILPLTSTVYVYSYILFEVCFRICGHCGATTSAAEEGRCVELDSTMSARVRRDQTGSHKSTGSGSFRRLS